MNEHTDTTAAFSGWRDLTVGQLVSRFPQSARVFERSGIDYCCGGKRTLQEACAKKGLDAEAIRKQLAEALGEAPDADEFDWGGVSVAQLVDHIETSHHRYIRDERPRLTALAHKVARVHGSRHAELIVLASAVDRLFADLEPHLEKEEREFFPACRKWSQAGPGAPQEAILKTGLDALEAEHTDLGTILESIRNLTSGFEPPQDACNSYLALFHGLEQMEADLHAHIHKENNILHARLSGNSGAGESRGKIPDTADQKKNGPRPESCCGL